MSKCNGNTGAFSVDPLEQRCLLSGAPWGQQGLQISQDLAAINYPQITGAGQTIAVIDIGTDYHHPALGGGIGAGFKVLDGYDFMNNTSDPVPKDGIIPHGTASAGLAAGTSFDANGFHFQGIAPGANLVALRAYGGTVTPALDWVIAHRQQYNIVAVQVLGADNSLQASEIQTLVNAGVFLGTNSGNGGSGKPIPNLPGVVRTGSVDANNQISWFTQRGARMDLLAPGDNVIIPWETDGQQGETTLSGTSWASPQVVGAAALIKQINPAFNEAQILSIMQDSGTPVYDSVTGMTFKELNVNSALGLAFSRSQPTPTPTAPPHHRHHPVPPPPPPPHHHHHTHTISPAAVSASYATPSLPALHAIANDDLRLHGRTEAKVFAV